MGEKPHFFNFFIVFLTNNSDKWLYLKKIKAVSNSCKAIICNQIKILFV